MSTIPIPIPNLFLRCGGGGGVGDRDCSKGVFGLASAGIVPDPPGGASSDSHSFKKINNWELGLGGRNGLCL